MKCMRKLVSALRERTDRHDASNAPRPRARRLTKAVLSMLGAAVAALLVSGHTNAVETFEITMNFYSTDVVQGNYHSGWIDATEPFSRVEWWVGGTLETTDYATHDAQTHSTFSTYYTGLGSESGKEVTVYALAYARNSSSRASDEETIAVFSTAEDLAAANGGESDLGGAGSSGKPKGTISTIARPWIESYANCENKNGGLFDLLFGDDHHEMEVEVRPTYRGGGPNGVPGYYAGKIWTGTALVYIHLQRDGRCRGCSSNGGFFLPNGVCDEPIDYYERPPNTRAEIAAEYAKISENPEEVQNDHGNDHTTDLSVEILKVTRVEGSRTFSIKGEVFGVGVNSTTEAPKKSVGMLGWWLSDPVYVSANVQKGLPGEVSSFIGWINHVEGKTKGVAEGKLKDVGGYDLAPKSEANHGCPDGDNFYEDSCTKDNSKSGRKKNQYRFKGEPFPEGSWMYF